MTVKLFQSLKYHGSHLQHLESLINVEKNIVLTTNEANSGQGGKRYGKKVKKGGNKSKGAKNSSS